jgi:hypothetical protein
VGLSFGVDIDIAFWRNLTSGPDGYLQRPGGCEGPGCRATAIGGIADMPRAPGACPALVQVLPARSGNYRRELLSRLANRAPAMATWVSAICLAVCL